VLVVADVYSLENKLLLHREEKHDTPADNVANGFALELAPLLSSDEVVLVNLELKSDSGEILSRNFYWLGAQSRSYRSLNRLAAATLAATAKTTAKTADSIHLQVELRNTGSAVALQNKLTLLNAGDGSRILPAYYSDNYVSLLPGETRMIEIEYPASAATGPAQISLRGWNLAAQTVQVH
jgi:hypothetical protein